MINLVCHSWHSNWYLVFLFICISYQTFCGAIQLCKMLISADFKIFYVVSIMPVSELTSSNDFGGQTYQILEVATSLSNIIE